MRVVIMSPAAIASATAEPANSVYRGGQILEEKPIVLSPRMAEKLVGAEVAKQWSNVLTKTWVLRSAPDDMPGGTSEVCYCSPDDVRGERDARLVFPEMFVE